ncbi:tRNA preQ1(34) S-adenosylmethionine ribosyltransferase-isomerase QueA [Candidatus Endowatersipora endosymbiont of Watersipora subatra]|uniref:tRNA preQ1(34) S-adenosylmethionine ribosyltransferase-isomerase QueA n=1 Tax=Candidatus Endowatersipora endosymbiont of Watersipora subatra TaxID=3077946 RepID=UPI00312CAC67
MRVDIFDFELPKPLIATRPANPRDHSRLMVINKNGRGSLDDRYFLDIEYEIKPGDALLFNDTRVIPAQLEGFRVRRGHRTPISLTLHMRISGNRWLAFARGASKIQSNDRLEFYSQNSKSIKDLLIAYVISKKEMGEIECEFNFTNDILDLMLTIVGKIPLPPYIASQRAQDTRDWIDYQTVYARENGAVAAPTAGLHFTEDLLLRLQKKGIFCQNLTLHIGAGTFLPVKVSDSDDHIMHSEIGFISEETSKVINRVKKKGGRIFAVGTTSLRLLESASDDKGNIDPWAGKTDLFITPGYNFKTVDALITNFHLPRSTLFMLVSSFSGLNIMKKAYSHAIKNHYRFYSYGDASLLYLDR